MQLEGQFALCPAAVECPVCVSLARLHRIYLWIKKLWFWKYDSLCCSQFW